MPAGIVTRRLRLRSVRPVALARLARALDDLALAPAARAGLDVDHLAEHRLADAADLAATLALGAGRGLGAGLGAAPGAGLAATEDPEFDLLVGASDGLLERDPQVVAEVGAGLRSTTSGRAAARRAAEERIEDVAEAAEALEPGARAAGAAIDPGPAEHVVALAPLRVGQDLVGLAGLLEPAGRLGILVDVRVPLLGELAEGALDLGFARAALETEDLVEIAFRGGHLCSKSTRGGRELADGVGSPARATARATTASNIAGVSRPVNVFCCDGWYEPRSTYRPTAASAPCPNRGLALAAGTWPAGGHGPQRRVPAERPERQHDPHARASSPISRTRNGAQVSRSSIVGLLAGGAQRTAAAMYVSVSVSPSSAAARRRPVRQPGAVERRPTGSRPRRHP